jgi:hypothetical protein
MREKSDEIMRARHLATTSADQGCPAAELFASSKMRGSLADETREIPHRNLMIVGAALSSARAAHFRNAHLRENPW